MYSGELLQYYQSSNNIPQSAQTLDFDLKSCFVLLNTSSRSARCRLVSVSIFVVLVCSTPRVALLVVELTRLSQPFLLCVEHLDSLCSLFSCLWRLSKYSDFRRTGSCKLLSSLAIEFPSTHVSFARAFEYISTFFSSLSIRFLSFWFLYFCYCFPQYPTFTRRR